MAYHPNFADPRVRTRIQKAYGFARGVLSETEPHGWSTRYIDRYFGHQGNNLAQWLRHHLLICVNDRYSRDAGITKQYRLNLTGCDYIRSVLQGTTQATQEQYLTDSSPFAEYDLLNHADHKIFDHQVVTAWIRKEFADELETGTFNYEDKSSRLWHPLQSVRSRHKRPILAQAGLQYHYDIQCAAPTLIHQHAQRYDMDLYLFALRRYLNDRHAIRESLAHELNVELRVTKVLINALFCGARVGNNPDFAISQLLYNDPARIEYLRQHQYITQLRDDIKTCWDYIKPSMARRSITNRNNRQQMLPISPREKWARYFELERVVLNSVIDYLEQHNCNYFLEHDGWASSCEIDVTELSDQVHKRTGYRVQFERDYVRTEFETRMLNEELIA